MNVKQKKFLPIAIILVVFAVAYFYPLPYFVSAPGEAMELSPIVKVEQGYPEQGSFMLTTIRMGEANIFNYALARWDEYRDIVPKEVLLAHYQNEEEFTQRQIQVMESSKENAIAVAYELAGRDVQIEYKGVMVVSTIEDMPAEEHFQFGDIITHVDGEEVHTAEALIKYLKDKSLGDEVTISFTREGESMEAMISLEELPLTEDEETHEHQPRAGIGISTVTKRNMEVDPPVEIETSRIGGPSAGLMFSLEIYNQLTEHDITKGYRVAGTGTIAPDGMVGRIGGIHQKIVAADKAGAEIFFAPHEEGAEESNYQRALTAAEDIGTEMKIVPVDYIKDALDYLSELPVHK
ncbi:SepM family pheromone-processing serine protease [Caldalkalibacillus salinus]|uniref:SepM family pheromone-processing serine protease n=1 Tax=Caldalkalibacillus salinus TaxID=2803787 RepID=UPI0019229C30|nr:SepM family pheromone-processing serine protease [Caldalkalibacillus salinus]